MACLDRWNDLKLNLDWLWGIPHSWDLAFQLTSDFREANNMVTLHSQESFQECFFSSLEVISCGFRQERVRLSDLLVKPFLQEPCFNNALGLLRFVVWNTLPSNPTMSRPCRIVHTYQETTSFSSYTQSILLPHSDIICWTSIVFVVCWLRK